jgi:hypothetical protein
VTVPAVPRRLLNAFVLLLALGGAGRVAAQPDTDAVTAAEQLLFQTDHMANVRAPSRLEYRYSHEGENPASDRVTLSIDEKRSVLADYLTGSRHVAFPGVDDAHGNPLLLYFLEDDLREMGLRTNGRPDYFRRLIRRAMARPDVKVEATEVSVDGKKLPAQRVVIEPFRSDPNAPVHYPALVGKSYEFVLSPALPGQVAMLATHVPLADGKTDTVRLDWRGAGPL